MDLEGIERLVSGCRGTQDLAVAHLAIEDVFHRVLAMRARVRAMLRVARMAPTRRDRMLTAKETAARCGLSTKWLYAQAGRLPFARRVGGRVRFSEAGLEDWMRLR